jgi:intergrase/recombinase
VGTGRHYWTLILITKMWYSSYWLIILGSMTFCNVSG